MKLLDVTFILLIMMYGCTPEKKEKPKDIVLIATESYNNENIFPIMTELDSILILEFKDDNPKENETDELRNDTSLSLLERMADKSEDKKKKKKNQAPAMFSQTRNNSEHPLLAILSPNLILQGEDSYLTERSSFCGISKAVDTSNVNKYLSIGIQKKMFPPGLEFKWLPYGGDFLFCSLLAYHKVQKEKTFSINDVDSIYLENKTFYRLFNFNNKKMKFGNAGYTMTLKLKPEAIKQFLTEAKDSSVYFVKLKMIDQEYYGSVARSTFADGIQMRIESGEEDVERIRKDYAAILMEIE